MIARLVALALASTLLVWSSGSAQDSQPKGKVKDAKAKAAAPRPVVQTGHQDKVTAAAFHPDGKTVATVSEDRTIRLWHVPTGKVLGTGSGHNAEVTAVAFSGDGSTLASGGKDKRVVVYNPVTGVLERWWDEWAGLVTAVALNSDGRLIAVAGSGKYEIKVRNPRDPHAKGSPVSLDGHSGPIGSLAFSPKGPILVSGGSAKNDHTVRVWNATNGNERHKLPGHPGGVAAVAFHPDGNIVASGGADGTVKLWDVRPKQGKLLLTLEGHTGKVVGVGFLNASTLVSVGEDHTVRYWNAATGAAVHPPKGESARVTIKPHLAVVSRDGGHLLVAGERNTTVLDLVRDRAGLGRRTPLTGLRDRGYCSSLSADGSMVAVGGYKSVSLWRPGTSRPLTILPDHEGAVLAVAFSPDGARLATACLNDDKRGVIRVFDTATGKLLGWRVEHHAHICGLAFSPDGKRLASASGDHWVGHWAVTRAGKLRDETLKLEPLDKKGNPARPDDVMFAVQFSPDGKYLAAAGDSWVWVWEVATGKLYHKFGSKDWAWLCLAFSPDSKTLAAGNKNGAIRLWDLPSKQQLRRFSADVERNQLSEVYGLAFSPDGKILAAAGEDRAVRLWDPATGKEVPRYVATEEKELPWPLYGHSHSVRSVGFTPDGKWLVSCSGTMWDWGNGDGVVRFWSVNRDGKGLRIFPRVSLVSLWDQVKKQASWVVFDGQGRYDASDGGDVRWLHWVLNGEPVQLSQLKERYYDPHLLAKHLGLNPELPRKVGAAFAPKPPPRPEVKPDPKAKTATVTVADRGGGVGAVRVLVNGKEVDARAGADGKLTVDLKNAPLTGRGDKLKVVAWNADGDLASRGVELDLDAEPATPKHDPELYAIVVGVSSYQNPKLDLRFSAKDAESITAALRLGGERMFGVKKVHLTLLSSGATGPEGKPTKANIAAAFAAAQKAHPDDVFVVFMAGHGVAPPGTDLYCYLTADATDLDLKKYADPKVRAEQAVSSDELVEWIKRVKALKQVMVLDTCAAGQFTAGTFGQRRDVPSAQIRAVELLKDRTGFHVLMGCAADRVSYEANRFQQGLLTYALLHGMQGPALRKGGDLEVTDLFRHAWEKVPELATAIGGVQQPVISSPQGAPVVVGKLTEADRNQIHVSHERPQLVRPRLTDKADGGDGLKLQSLVRARLGDPASARGAACAFVDTEEMAHAYHPIGQYEVSGNNVTVTVRVEREKEVWKLTPINGTADRPEALADAVADALRKWKPSK